MTRFRPCIDIFSGKVTQIVGGTLKDNSKDKPPTATDATQRSQEESQHTTNHTSHLPSSHFARLYRENGLKGGHVIMLSTSEDSQAAASEACATWPGEMQVGGGINEQNAPEWIAAGAGKVIVTSYLFPDARFSIERLRKMIEALDGDHSKLVIDLSCRRQRPQERQERDQKQEQQQKEDPNNSTGNDGNTDESGPSWIVAMDKWQKPTDMMLSKEIFNILSPYCSEFLVHAADVEGKQQGIDEELVQRLAEWCSLPITYAGGARSIEDLKRVKRLSGGKVDLTIGSALDVFGGNGVALEDCVRWNGGAQQ